MRLARTIVLLLEGLLWRATHLRALGVHLVEALGDADETPRNVAGIMGLAFGAEAALRFSGVPGWQWGLTAVIAVVASAAFSVLELFVAFLQAYIITFLSALFIGASLHKH